MLVLKFPARGLNMLAKRSKNPGQKSSFNFRRALLASGLSVIAEIKRRSPSAGDLKPDLDVAELACQYALGGAACLSVLTEGLRFGGSVEDLQQARQASGLPVLRKDFLISPDDIYATKAIGADALLLIVADIVPAQLRPLIRLAGELGLDGLVEIRNRAELEAALAAGADMIAVNQRGDPKSADFSLDYGLAVALAPRLAEVGGNLVRVAASGIGVDGGTSPADLAAAGYDAALVGEALLTASDPAAKLKSLLVAE